MTRKICVVTGSRAEYGLLRWVMQGLKEDSDLELQVIATGMHLSPEFGLTYREIEKDGFHINRKVEMLLSGGTTSSIGKSMGLAMIGFSDALRGLAPDLMLVLGDRFEVFAAVATAMVERIPVAHLHGGELTEGLIDEAMRHSITKMSHLHFVAVEEYRRRVIQLGEHPDRVFLVGGLGLDNLRRIEFLQRDELEKQLDFKFGARNLLVTFHPVTLEEATAAQQLDELLAALDALEDIHVIFTMPNADAEGRELFGIINDFVARRPNARAYTSLGQSRYLSCLRYVDAVIGNSSSGLIEVPSFGKATVNIGDRQRGRLKADSVIDCDPERDAILGALNRSYSAEFRRRLTHVRNPYGEGGASAKVVDIIRNELKDGILKKKFFDCPNPCV